jgi:hypothetical protein
VSYAATLDGVYLPSHQWSGDVLYVKCVTIASDYMEPSLEEAGVAVKECEIGLFHEPNCFAERVKAAGKVRM